MTQQQPDETTQAQEPDGHAQPPEESSGKKPVGHSGGRAATGLSILVLVLLIGASAVAALMILRGQDQQSQLQRDVSTLTSDLQGMSERLQDNERQLQQTVTSVRQAEQRLQDSMQKLFDEVGRNKRDWALAETEYLIRLAQHRLQLSRDAATARQALVLAGRRLQDINDPTLVGLREQIAAQVSALDQVLARDENQALVGLAQLVDQADDLPLLSLKKTAGADKQAAVTAASDAQQPAWHRYLKDMWEIISPMIRIRRQDKPVTPLLPPEQHYFLQQNLILQLRNARLSALVHDDAGYARSLNQAQQWVEKYFDNTTKPVTAFLASLDELRGISVDPALPDLSGLVKQAQQLQQPGKEAAAQ
jgi:uncharacterized protein HemX